MIKDLRDARLVDAVPRVVAGQDWVRALSEAVGVLHERTLRYIDDSQIYTSLDTATEPVLDALAINWKVDWYDTGYSVEQKRRIIKTALTVRRLMGTVGAVKLQADAIYPGTMLEEWFEYGGQTQRRNTRPLFTARRKWSAALLPRNGGAPTLKALATWCATRWLPGAGWTSGHTPCRSAARSTAACGGCLPLWVIRHTMRC